MSRILGCVLLLGCVFAALPVTTDNGHFAVSPTEGLDELTASGKHKSWCTFKSGAAQVWCKAKANATFDPTKRRIALDNCSYNYNLAIQQCPKRRLDQSMSSMAEKHKSWCTFKASVANKWCQTKAIATVDATKRRIALDNCAYNLNLANQQCPKRRLNQMLNANGQKHKSWCTFKASVARTWCKTKAVRFNASSRNSGYINCDNTYNMAVAQCAQRRLMKDMEKAILSGNAHEGWCEFKNRSKWLWCKAAKSINTNAQARRDNLTRCDADYNLGDALCRNVATTVTVNNGSTQVTSSTATTAH